MLSLLHLTVPVLLLCVGERSLQKTLLLCTQLRGGWTLFAEPVEWETGVSWAQMGLAAAAHCWSLSWAEEPFCCSREISNSFPPLA